jgi:hypothetical protein
MKATLVGGSFQAALEESQGLLEGQKDMNARLQKQNLQLAHAYQAYIAAVKSNFTELHHQKEALIQIIEEHNRMPREGPLPLFPFLKKDVSLPDEPEVSQFQQELRRSPRFSGSKRPRGSEDAVQHAGTSLSSSFASLDEY